MAKVSERARRVAALGAFVTVYMASRLDGQFFFYVAIFICHLKTNTPAFQQM